MTQEDKDLLLRDISARLPYVVQIRIPSNSGKTFYEATICEITNRYVCVKGGGDTCYGYGSFKPYLRPMSSMTEEEFHEYMKFTKHSWSGIDKSEDCYYVKVTDRAEFIDFLYLHHFDFRGLIEKGLALEAPEGMYKIN